MPPVKSTKHETVKPGQTAGTDVVDAEFTYVSESTSKGELVATGENRSILRAMADRYHMEPKPFQDVVMATCFPVKAGERPISPPEFAGFLLIAYEHGLNPMRREIYGFRGQSGAIVPIVSIDGWMNIINQHKAMDGIEFDDHVDDKNNIYAITCRIFRKDRSHPIVVTEYLEECRRGTDPWKKWPYRMLRHKAAIQCARYAFSFSGIYDPDEAERMGIDVSAMHDITPPAGNGQGASLMPQNQARDSGPPSPRKTAPAPPRTETAPPSTEQSAMPAAAAVEGAITSPVEPAESQPATQEGQKPQKEATEAKAGLSRQRPATGPAVARAAAIQAAAKAEDPQDGDIQVRTPIRPSVERDPEGFLRWLNDEFRKIEPGPGCERDFIKLWDDDTIPRLEGADTSVQEGADGIMRMHQRRLGLG